MNSDMLQLADSVTVVDKNLNSGRQEPQHLQIGIAHDCLQGPGCDAATHLYLALMLT